jgi:lambda repressor-like predicted transcriptional regulator
VAIENRDTVYASGNRTHTKSRSKALPNLSEEAGAAIDALMNAFRISPNTREQAIAEKGL